MFTRFLISIGTGHRALRRRAPRAVTLLEYVLLGAMALGIILTITAIFAPAVRTFFQSVAQNL